MLYSTALVWATSNLSLFEEKPEDTTVEFLECALEAISSVVPEDDSQVPESADAAAAAQSAQSTPAPGTSDAGSVAAGSAASGASSSDAGVPRRYHGKQPLRAGVATAATADAAPQSEMEVTFDQLDSTWGRRFGAPGSQTKRCRYLKSLKCQAELSIADLAYKHQPNKYLKYFSAIWRNEMDAHKNIHYVFDGPTATWAATPNGGEANQKPNFQLVFHGRITAFPGGKQYYSVCKAGGTQFYMVPDNDFFSPAWHIPCSSDAEEVTCALKQHDLRIAVKQGSNAVYVRLNVYSVVLRDDIDPSINPVHLVRPKLPSEEGGKLPDYLKIAKKLVHSELVFNAIGWKYQAPHAAVASATATTKGSKAHRSGDDKWSHIKNFTKY